MIERGFFAVRCAGHIFCGGGRRSVLLEGVSSSWCSLMSWTPFIDLLTNTVR